MRLPAFPALLAASLALWLPGLASSAPNAASGGTGCVRSLASTGSGTIQISEVEADPVLSGTDTPDEWFELTNVGSTTATLAGWTISDSAATDPLPAVTIAAGRCVVVAASTGGFLAGHAGYAQPVLAIADGALGNGLSNGGDSLTVVDAGGVPVDCVAWGTATGCFSPAVPPTAANSAVTLQRTSAVDTDTSADWAAAGETPCGTGPTAVRATSLRAARVGSRAVRLTWRAPPLQDVAGFRVWRASAGSGRYRRVGRGLIAARPAAGVYRFVDRAAPQARALRYRLQVVMLDGRSEWAGSAVVVPPSLSRPSRGS